VIPNYFSLSRYHPLQNFMIPAKPLAIAQITDIHLFADTKKNY
jgi:hypothetical protein